MLWFVLGPGGLREAAGAPEGPRMVLEGLPGAPGAPGARVKKPQNAYLLQGPTERPRYVQETRFDLFPAVPGLMTPLFRSGGVREAIK